MILTDGSYNGGNGQEESLSKPHHFIHFQNQSEQNISFTK